MSVQLCVVAYEAATEAAHAFCADYSLWMEASSVSDFNALDELSRRYAEAGLTEADEFTILFDGDYKTSVDSNDLRHG